MMRNDLPRFGPTEVVDDPGVTPEVIVRTDIALSREQLVAALSVAYASLAPDVDPDSLTVVQTRTEIEAMLTESGIVDIDNLIALDRDGIPAEEQAVADALRRAVDRAYPTDTPEPTPPRRQDPRYRDGTVILDTVDHGEVTVREPAWCTGHDDDTVDYLAGITHNGRTCATTAITAEFGEVTVARAQISHGPHLVEQPEPYPTLHIALDLHQSFNPEDGRAVTRALRVAACRIDRTLDDLEAMRRAEQ
jgi:hypothetical protein